MLRALAILLLLSAPAWGQAVVPFAQCANGQCQRQVWLSPQAMPLPARCRVRTDSGEVGSGTLVCRTDTDATVITAYHVVKKGSRPVIIEFPQGGRFAGVVAAYDEFYDLAAVKIGPCQIEPVELSDDLTGTLAAGGFGGDGVFATVHGTVSGYVSYDANMRGERMPVITGSVRSGDSGGGVTNADKKLVGVVWGVTNGQTYITAGKPLQQLVRQVCGNHRQNLVSVGSPPPPVAHNFSQPPAPSPQPSIDWPAKYEKLEADFAGLQTKFDTLQKEVANYKECSCGDCCQQVAASVDAKIATAIAAVHIPQPAKPPPPNYDAIAAEVSKRLTHSAAITLLDGSKKTQTKPLGEPLEFIQHSKGLK